MQGSEVVCLCFLCILVCAGESAPHLPSLSTTVYGAGAAAAAAAMNNPPPSAVEQCTQSMSVSSLLEDVSAVLVRGMKLASPNLLLSKAVVAAGQQAPTLERFAAGLSLQIPCPHSARMCVFML